MKPTNDVDAFLDSLEERTKSNSAIIENDGTAINWDAEQLQYEMQIPSSVANAAIAVFALVMALVCLAAIFCE